MADVEARHGFLLVIGGHARNTGKTSLITGLISALSEIRWTAVKISGHRHGLVDERFALTEEAWATGPHDTCRYLAAGAARSYWLRVSDADLGHAIPAIQQTLRDDRHVIVESNRIVEHLSPDLFLIVLNPDVGDFKQSARLLLERADGFVRVCSRDGGPDRPPSEPVGLLTAALRHKPLFPTSLPAIVTPALLRFVRDCLSGGLGGAGGPGVSRHVR